jgi:hypothetical protein
MISTAENSNKFQKTKFWKEKSMEDVVTLGPTAQAMLINFIKTKHEPISWKAMSCDRHKN